MLKKLLKYITIILFSIFLLLGSAIGIAYLYRNKIIALFVNEANKHLSTKILVDEISLEFWETFPHFSIAFKNIRIKESVEGSDKNFAEAKNLFISLSIKDILEKKIKIKQIHINDGTLNFKIDKKGNNNFTIIKESTENTTKNAIVFELSDVQLKDMRLIYKDLETDNDYDIVAKNAKAQFRYNNFDWDISLQTDILSNELKFNKLSFFKNKPMQISSTLTYTEIGEKYVIKSTEIKVLDAIFTLDGRFSFDKKPYADLKFSEKNSDIKTILSLIPQDFGKPLAAYNSNGKVYFKGIINGFFGRGFRPFVKIDFGCNQASLTHPKLGIAIKNMGFVGQYSNGTRNKDDSSYFKMKDIKAIISDKFISGNITLSDLKNPVLYFDLKSSVDAAFCNKHLENSPLTNLTGQVDFDIIFKGNINEINKKNYQSVSSQGFITLQNLAFGLKNKKYDFYNMNAKIFFNNTDIDITNFACRVGNSDIQLDGSLKNIIPYLAHANQQLELQAHLKSKKLYLDELMTNTDQNNGQKITYNLSSRISLNLLAHIDDFRFKKISASNISSKVLLKNKKLSIENTSLNIANGFVKMDAIIEQNQDSTLQVNANIDIKKAQIDSIFYMNDNFGQSFITNENIKGTLTSVINTQFYINNTGLVDKKTLKADIKLNIENGKLVNFAVIQKMSKFVYEDALANISFSQLNNDIKISNEKIIIPEMVLKSNITTMQVSGTHGFDNEFEYHIKLPLRNYRKKENLEDAQSIENDGKGGLNLYLKIYGNPSNFKVSYDSKAVKEHIIEKLKTIKDDFKEVFKKDYIKNKIEKAKTVELKEDEFLDLN